MELRVAQGTGVVEVTRAELAVASDDYGAGCPDTGEGCVNFYAVSIPGVTPSAFLTWLQAAAAARNAAGEGILKGAFITVGSILLVAAGRATDGKAIFN